VLRPDWLVDCVYLGRESTGGIDCHLWGKEGFIVYYEDVLTGRPVRWNFIDGTHGHSISIATVRHIVL
jgi:hypothetical protein